MSQSLRRTDALFSKKVVAEAGEREGWCGTPPYSVSLVAAVAGCEEDEALALAAVRARFGAIAAGR